MNRLFGPKSFYKRVIALTLPIMVQNGITNFVNMLDNVMVGQVGTVQMTGTAVANQLIFVFNLCIFGAISGAGIFGAQFYGKEDHEGVRHTLRFKLWACVLLSAAAIGLFLTCGEPLCNLYLQGEGNVTDAAASLRYGKEYLWVMLIGLVPYSLAQAYASTLRETGQTVPPMVAGVAAVLVNLFGNYVLIFGNFGAPRLGVIGAAIATVISRFVELLIVVTWTHKNKEQNPFCIGLWRSVRVPKQLTGEIFRKGMPLLFNETMWAAGVAITNQCYSIRGLEVVAANNISQTFWNVFSVAFLAVGAAIGILLGQMLGAGETEEARHSAGWLITFSVITALLVSGIYFVVAQWIPLLYNTDQNVRYTAMRLMQICAVAMPIDAFAHATYFTLRSGGKTFITILFDSVFMWVVTVPLAFVLCRFTALPLLTVYAICQIVPIIKCFAGWWLVHKGIWIRNIVDQT